MNINVLKVILVISTVAFLAGSCQKFRDHKKARMTLKEKKEERKNTENVSNDTLTLETEKVVSDSLFFYYEKTPCFGRCPIFKLTIYHSGFATYDGINFVDNIGFHKAKLKFEQMGKIRDLLNGINFFSLDDTYDNEHVMDIPARIIEARYDGKKKRILARYQAPQELRDVFNEIDKLFENTEWEPYSSN